ncbi:hypothetical protein ACFV30_27305 [Streptomyces sp. NPDC059752]|uniref:hypothetical protein n=1 Tax=unclassified Streptomyces TaxID=2593676 RepID=UPI00365C1C07
MSLMTAYDGVRVMQSIAKAERQDAARTEISEHVVKISELDRAGQSGSPSEIITRARRVESLIASHGEQELNLGASTYRLIGLFLALSTTDLELAARMVDRGLKVADRKVADGSGGLHMGDPLEALQSHRVLGDIAAQNLDFHAMMREYKTALEISEAEGWRNRYVNIEGRQYTRIYWTLSAMQLVEDVAKPTAEMCVEVRRRADIARKDFASLGDKPEILRRVGRIDRDVCATWIDLPALKRRWEAMRAA